MSDPVRKRIQLTLRTNQVTYLEYLCERGRITIHQAFEQVIGAHRSDETQANRPPRKERVDVWLSNDSLNFLDLLAARAGLERSDMARRLIDETQAADPRL
jgi:hypothetical protein